MSELTHFNKEGRAKMVDVSEKAVTTRSATAASSIRVNEKIYENITNNKIKKGDVLGVAQVAAVMAGKKTWETIPMCHPIPLTGIDISYDWQENSPNEYELLISATVKTKGITGVEMEALTAASVCALTVYDMCKAIDKGMVIGPTYLLSKTGGKSGDFQRPERLK